MRTPFLKNTLFAGNTTQKEMNCPRVLCNILSFNGPADLLQDHGFNFYKLRILN
jgi:hypothetical protein